MMRLGKINARKLIRIVENDTLYITPRVIAIFFIPLISLFVIDIFNGELFIPFIPVALLVHLIPSLVILTALLYAWKNEKRGGVIFIFLFWLGMMYFKNPYPSNIALFAPLLLTGLLFEIHSSLFIKK